MAKLASGRVGAKSSDLLDLFNASLPFDQKLYQEDIEGLKACITEHMSQSNKKQSSKYSDFAEKMYSKECMVQKFLKIGVKLYHQKKLML